MSMKNEELEAVIGQYSSMLYKICFLILKTGNYRNKRNGKYYH